MGRLGRVLTVAQGGPKCTASIIALHGAGGCGPSLLEWWSQEVGRSLVFPEWRVLFPTAPAMPYALYGGEVANVWLDRKAVDIEAEEIPESISAAKDTICALIDSEVEKGVPLDRIVVGGFSQGGTLALHLGYGADRPLAGVFAMSSFINRRSMLYRHMDAHPSSPRPPLFQSHGTRDDLVLHPWGQETNQQLRSRGVTGWAESKAKGAESNAKGEESTAKGAESKAKGAESKAKGAGLVTAQGVEHQLDRSTLLKLHDWLTEVLPPVETP